MDKKAEWTRDISKHICLGTKTCKLGDTSAEWLRDNRGAEVRTCSTLQDGTSCSDYDCTKYKSHVRRANGKVRCMYGVWERLELDYCTFCPAGQHKVNITSCEPCAVGKHLISGKYNDVTECRNCSVGHYWSNDLKDKGLNQVQGRSVSRLGGADIL